MAETHGRTRISLSEMLEDSDVIRDIQEAMIELTVKEDADLDLPDSTLFFKSVQDLMKIPMMSMQDQTVLVDYLRDDQLLIIPAALGMPLAENAVGRCPIQSTLRQRYLKAATMTYADIKTLCDDNDSFRIREVVDAMQPGTELARRMEWTKDEWFVLANNAIQSRPGGDGVMRFFSHALEFNCDIRDYGILNESDMFVADDAWKTADTIEVNRVKNKLQELTLQCIAALNVGAVEGCELAAWVRAYGVGMGVLPADGSKFVKQFKFVNEHPSADNTLKVVLFNQQFDGCLITLCENLLALFGIFHLNQDHTYKSSDKNLVLIANSYLDTLRSNTNSKMMKHMFMNMEAVVRTAPHPFGLAQTYWLARVLNKHDKLMEPLAVMIDVFPLSVKCLVTIYDAVMEWEKLAVWKNISDLYMSEIGVIRDEVDRIKASPPAYSRFAKLYGMVKGLVVSDGAKSAIVALTPAAFGYWDVVHADKKIERDRIRHATGPRDCCIRKFWVRKWRIWFGSSAGVSNQKP